ncbi:MAG: hypothetical protein P8Y97_19360, partial [Candidatus Lokiarchaeota archaeon]
TENSNVGVQEFKKEEVEELFDVPQAFEVELANYNDNQERLYAFALDIGPEGILIIAPFIENERKIELKQGKSRNPDLNRSVSNVAIEVMSLKIPLGPPLSIV